LWPTLILEIAINLLAEAPEGACSCPALALCLFGAKRSPRRFHRARGTTGADRTPTVRSWYHDSPSAVKSGVMGFSIACAGQGRKDGGQPFGLLGAESIHGVFIRWVRSLRGRFISRPISAPILSVEECALTYNKKAILRTLSRRSSAF